MDFHERRRPIFNALLEHANYLKEQEADAYQALMASRQLFDVLEFYKANFWWKPGRYAVLFGIEGREDVQLDRDTFEFELMQHDVDALQHNLELTKLDFENAVRSSLPDFEPKPVPWAWRNIPLVKS